MGINKDYEDPIEIASSYKILGQILRKPNLIQLNDNKPKNYEKTTISLTNRQLPDGNYFIYLFLLFLLFLYLLYLFIFLESKTILNITS